MAHELATSENGLIMMAYQGQTPWHKLGNVMPENATVEQAMEAAGLNWQVELEPLYLADGRKVDRKAVVRATDSRPVLNTVGPDYQVIQNAEAFNDVLSAACENAGVVIETAGAIYDGRKVWMQAKMPTVVEAAKGDTVQGYFLLTTGHDGVTSYGARFTPQRVVCKNTMEMALSNGSTMFRVHHTKNAVARLDEAKRMVENMFVAMETTGDTISQLAQHPMTGEQVAAYIKKVLPDIFAGKRDEYPSLIARRETIANLVYNGTGAKLAGSQDDGTTTAWAAYNAFTEYVDHVRPAEDKQLAKQSRANISAAFGMNYQLKVNALQAARELVMA